MMKRYIILLSLLCILVGCGTLFEEPSVENYQEGQSVSVVPQQGISRPTRLDESIELGIADYAYVELDWGGLGEGPTYTYQPAPTPEPTPEPTPTPTPEPTPEPTTESVDETPSLPVLNPLPQLEIPILFPNFPVSDEVSETE